MDRLGDRRGAPAQTWRAPLSAAPAAARVDARENRLHAALRFRDMEVVLLWLDDLDDALFSLALAWERLRRTVLKIGLSSAFALAGAELSTVAATWAPTFAYVAAASVATWFAGAALRAFYYRESNRFLTAA
jgi:hypothetical protein